MSLVRAGGQRLQRPGSAGAAEERGVAAGIIYKRVRGEKKLSSWKRKFNRIVSALRAVASTRLRG